MKRLLNRLNNFFFPPAGASKWIRILPFAVLGLLTLILLTAGAYGWEYTNSSEFCGTTCHTMPPEYTAFLTSPHARIDCVDCHIGKSFIATRITRKAGDLKHITATIFKNYEYPIRAAELRPARETCELCHFPEKFSDDSLRQVQHYQNDLDNTPYNIYLDLRTGGGSQRQGLGRGIHWHIENKILYLPTDPEEQQIPYVRVEYPDGTLQEYTDLNAKLDPSTIDPSQLKEMDCITCHNRVSHLVPTPEETVDQLLARGKISTKIPEIHRKAIEVYSRVYATTEEGVVGITGLEDYYQTYYPEFYATNSQDIKDAISALQTAYQASVYPEQSSDWTAHPNNIGHKDSPGCFRCHDGKHMDANQKSIRLECNLCHAVPVVAGPYDFVADMEISRGPEPLSHQNANWISQHNQVFNTTCSNCHDTKDPGGVSNTSFCSNSACHGNVWTYAGFDAPALRKVIQSQLPPTPTPAPLPTGGALTYQDTIGPLFKSICASCHGDNGIQGLNLTTYETAMKGSLTGPVIVPGNPEQSLLVQKQSGPQPHFGQLTPEQLQLVIDWITAGASEK
jgi:nitrate/TMAO reductase-like tetraheme cytochrome c subunit/mono/diheme cytochrome c family protein